MNCKSSYWGDTTKCFCTQGCTEGRYGDRWDRSCSLGCADGTCGQRSGACTNGVYRTGQEIYVTLSCSKEVICLIKTENDQILNKEHYASYCTIQPYVSDNYNQFDGSVIRSNISLMTL